MKAISGARLLGVIDGVEAVVAVLQPQYGDGVCVIEEVVLRRHEQQRSLSAGPLREIRCGDLR